MPKPLEHIAGERLADIRPALAAFLRGENDMRLLQRVRNVLEQPPHERSRLWPAGLAALALPLGLWAAAAWNASAIASDDRDKGSKPAENDAAFVRRAFLNIYGRQPQPDELREFFVSADDDDEKPNKRERAESDKIKRAARLQREEAEAAKQAEIEKQRVRGLIDEKILDRKKSEPAEVREERYVIIRDGQPPEERIERVIVTRDGRTAENVIRKKITDAKGKAIVEVEEAVDKKQATRSGNDHRLDELTALIKQLSRNVERLQNEVSELRGQKHSDKPAAPQKPQANKFEREADDLKMELAARKRELERAAEKIETAHRELEEQKRDLSAQFARRDKEALQRAVRQKNEEAADQKRQAQAAELKAREAQEKAELKAGEAKEKAIAVEREKKERVMAELNRAKELKEQAIKAKEQEIKGSIERERKILEKKLKDLKDGQDSANLELDDIQLETKLKKILTDEQALLK